MTSLRWRRATWTRLPVFRRGHDAERRKERSHDCPEPAAPPLRFGLLGGRARPRVPRGERCRSSALPPPRAGGGAGVAPAAAGREQRRPGDLAAARRRGGPFVGGGEPGGLPP